MPRVKTATQTKPMLTDRTGKRNPRVTPKDPETGELLIMPEDARAPAKVPGGEGNNSKAEKALYLQKAEQSLKWQQLKNERAEKEMQAKLGTLVELEVIKRHVLAANVSVKNQVLAVIERENIPHDVRVRLKHKMIEALNELAYENSPRSPRA
jgi:hypothetical protein